MDRFLVREGVTPPRKAAKTAAKKLAADSVSAASPAPRAPTRQSAAPRPNSRSKSVKEISPHQDERGNGTPKAPYTLPLRNNFNLDDCLHCNTDHCCCTWMQQLLLRVFDEVKVKRIVSVAGSRHLCAKSVLPTFVTRMLAIAKVTSKETFYDLGCGNGSVMFQVAYMTGARCVGVEMSPQNAEVARQAWELIRPVLEKKANRKMPEVVIITGDLCDVINDPLFATRPSFIWTANLLMPKIITHYMSERFRSLPIGTRIMCFDDLYCHSRSVAKIRDPEAFEKFEMVDYIWQEMSVEWCAQEGEFYFYYKKQ